MKIKGITDEDFVQYKKAAMFIVAPSCTMKCNKLAGSIVCQNYLLCDSQMIEISKEELCERYLKNKITNSIVIGGLEPFDSEMDLISFVDCLRNRYYCQDDIVIYTGYTEEELEEGYRDNGKDIHKIEQNLYQSLKNYSNIIVKFGRYIPNQKSHHDDVLGVDLCSSNQYAKLISNDSN